MPKIFLAVIILQTLMCFTRALVAIAEAKSKPERSSVSLPNKHFNAVYLQQLHPFLRRQRLTKSMKSLLRGLKRRRKKRNYAFVVTNPPTCPTTTTTEGPDEDPFSTPQLYNLIPGDISEITASELTTKPKSSCLKNNSSPHPPTCCKDPPTSCKEGTLGRFAAPRQKAEVTVRQLTDPPYGRLDIYLSQNFRLPKVKHRKVVRNADYDEDPDSLNSIGDKIRALLEEARSSSTTPPPKRLSKQEIIDALGRLNDVSRDDLVLPGTTVPSVWFSLNSMAHLSTTLSNKIMLNSNADVKKRLTKLSTPSWLDSVFLETRSPHSSHSRRFSSTELPHSHSTPVINLLKLAKLLNPTEPDWEGVKSSRARYSTPYRSTPRTINISERPTQYYNISVPTNFNFPVPTPVTTPPPVAAPASVPAPTHAPALAESNVSNSSSPSSCNFPLFSNLSHVSALHSNLSVVPMSNRTKASTVSNLPVSNQGNPSASIVYSPSFNNNKPPSSNNLPSQDLALNPPNVVYAPTLMLSNLSVAHPNNGRRPDATNVSAPQSTNSSDSNMLVLIGPNRIPQNPFDQVPYPPGANPSTTFGGNSTNVQQNPVVSAWFNLPASNQPNLPPDYPNPAPNASCVVGPNSTSLSVQNMPNLVEPSAPYPQKSNVSNAAFPNSQNPVEYARPGQWTPNLALQPVDLNLRASGWINQPARNLSAQKSSNLSDLYQPHLTPASQLPPQQNKILPSNLPAPSYANVLSAYPPNVLAPNLFKIFATDAPNALSITPPNPSPLNSPKAITPAGLPKAPSPSLSSIVKMPSNLVAPNLPNANSAPDLAPSYTNPQYNLPGQYNFNKVRNFPNAPLSASTPNTKPANSPMPITALNSYLVVLPTIKTDNPSTTIAPSYLSNLPAQNLPNKQPPKFDSFPVPNLGPGAPILPSLSNMPNPYSLPALNVRESRLLGFRPELTRVIKDPVQSSTINPADLMENFDPEQKATPDSIEAIALESFKASLNNLLSAPNPKPKQSSFVVPSFSVVPATHRPNLLLNWHKPVEDPLPDLPLPETKIVSNVPTLHLHHVPLNPSLNLGATEKNNPPQLFPQKVNYQPGFQQKSCCVLHQKPCKIPPRKKKPKHKKPCQPTPKPCSPKCPKCYNAQLRSSDSNQLNSIPLLGVNSHSSQLLNELLSSQALILPGNLHDGPPASDSFENSVKQAKSACEEPRDESCVMSDILNKLRELKDLQAPRDREDMSCSINGSWASSAGGVIVTIKVDGAGLKISTHPKSPPSRHGFLRDFKHWCFHGTAPFARFNRLIVTGINDKTKHIFTFIGECRVCGGVDMISGDWLIGRPSVNCNDQRASLELITDMWRKEELSSLKVARWQHLQKLKATPKCNKSKKQSTAATCANSVIARANTVTATTSRNPTSTDVFTAISCSTTDCLTGRNARKAFSKHRSTTNSNKVFTLNTKNIKGNKNYKKVSTAAARQTST